MITPSLIFFIFVLFIIGFKKIYDLNQKVKMNGEQWLAICKAKSNEQIKVENNTQRITDNKFIIKNIIELYDDGIVYDKTDKSRIYERIDVSNRQGDGLFDYVEFFKDLTKDFKVVLEVSRMKPKHILTQEERRLNDIEYKMLNLDKKINRDEYMKFRNLTEDDILFHENYEEYTSREIILNDNMDFEIDDEEWLSACFYMDDELIFDYQACGTFDFYAPIGRIGLTNYLTFVSTMINFGLDHFDFSCVYWDMNHIKYIIEYLNDTKYNIILEYIDDDSKCTVDNEFEDIFDTDEEHFKIMNYPQVEIMSYLVRDKNWIDVFIESYRGENDKEINKLLLDAKNEYGISKSAILDEIESYKKYTKLETYNSDLLHDFVCRIMVVFGHDERYNELLLELKNLK